MKKLPALFALLVLVGCSSPVDSKPQTPAQESAPSTQSTTQTTTPSATSVTSDTPHVAIVMNSQWKEVRRITLGSSTRSASAPTHAEIQAKIDADNALSLTTQEWVYIDTVPDIAHAPNGNVFYCDGITGLPRFSYLNLTRQYIVDHYQEFLDGAHGMTVYVDHIPPAPVLAKDSTPYEWYSLYVIEDLPTPGVKLYEDHAGYTADEVFHGQWILLPMDQTMPDGTPGGGWLNLDKYYEQMLGIYRDSLTRPQDNWPGVTKAHIVTRELYPPLPTSN